MIPSGSNYPQELDTNQNMFHVKDALRVVLAEDYNPGDTIITVVGDETTMRLFDDTGIITLTEQCSDPALRAISFYYGKRTLTTFEELEILPQFTDSVKPKDITNVTQNVMAEHHNSLKDALIAIENFVGKKGETTTKPLTGTMEQRINYLRNLVLAPKAWFTVDQTLGLAPLTVTFQDQSFRLGTDGTSHSLTYLWDFGDNVGPSIITINEPTAVPPSTTNVLVYDTDGGSIQKTYNAGTYDVTLTVTNDFGSDTVTFPNLITARLPAPDYATIEFTPRSGQILTSGSPVDGPYTETSPKIRSVTNTLISLYIPDSINPNTGNTDAGEYVDGSNNPIDPIVSYTWSFSDDLDHSNSKNATALFSIGGIYDLTLRTDTEFGAYRITTYSGAFDIVENVNLWLWTYGSGNNVYSTEFGLLSETFKTTSSNALTISQDDSFLTGQSNETQQKQEFARNNGFAVRGNSTSGAGGAGILYWASGRSDVQTVYDEKINMSEYNGFIDTYASVSSISRPWNWVDLASENNVYFILGGGTDIVLPNTSPTNQIKDTLNLTTLVDSQTTLSSTNYKNGANELLTNEVSFDTLGDAEQGNMSVYRSAWSSSNSTGYFMRNEGVGSFFRLRSFYSTSGNVSEPFVNINKLLPMSGSARVEGELVALTQGIYFFCNSGTVSAYDINSATWAIGGPGVNSSAFRLLQDTSVVGFDNSAQTLLATSDGGNIAYLSFDYSPNAFMKFNETDTTFSKITTRPSGNQWQMYAF